MESTPSDGEASQAPPVAPFYCVGDDKYVESFPSLDAVLTVVEAYDVDACEFWDAAGHRLSASRHGKHDLDVTLHLDPRQVADPGALAERLRSSLVIYHGKSAPPEDYVAAVAVADLAGLQQMFARTEEERMQSRLHVRARRWVGNHIGKR